jgi:hypothetical protein
MTIAAGFVHKDGVLLCGDALMEDDYSREYGWKILQLEGSWGIGCVAFTGTVDYAIAAVENIENRLKEIKPSAIREKLKAVFKEEYAEHVLAHSKCGEMAGPDYQLLIAIRPNDEKAQLYVTSGTTCHKIKQYRCIGIGSSLASYLLNPYTLGNMREEQIVCLSAYAMAGVKRTIRGCGGLSSFISLRNDGTTHNYLGQAMPRFVESVSQEFTRDVDQAFVSMFCDNDTDAEWNASILANRVRNIRIRWLKAKENGIPTTIDELPRAQ